MSKRFENKVAIVTGSGSGFGKITDEVSKDGIRANAIVPAMSADLKISHGLTKIAVDYLTKYQYDVSIGIGVTGVVVIMKNEEETVAMLRADMDALPATKDTSLAYASTVKARDDEDVKADLSHVC